ncbi:MAG: hypothetical protein JSW11_05530 [Candidatus Heimdallarchaeota archaeon]|nr:MAG: hypothetical protein JSW11_05530 [Candidatus Heimdallarchaeota archaeon]
MDKLPGRLELKYPAVRDQYHANAALFIIYLGFMIFYAFYGIGVYMEEEVGEFLLRRDRLPFFLIVDLVSNSYYLRFRKLELRKVR